MGIRQAISRFFWRKQGPVNLDAAANAMARIRGSYDSARNGDEYKNIWVNADSYDADSAHSREVRQTLVKRSRYEINNNGYSDGIAQTYATDVVGVGPSLRMLSGSPGFNQMVELQWNLWCKAVQFRRKLWCKAHAKHSDGESLGVMRINPRLSHPIKLDIVLYETEQCQTPFLPFGAQGYIDGIKFDAYGNPETYDILRVHPGAVDGLGIDLTPERVAADRVLHWFKMRRPGQHRGVPECASTLNLGAAARRYRESNLASAEMAADWSLVVKTQNTPDDADPVAPFTTMDVAKRQMAFLPMGWDASQLKAEFPTASYEAFQKTLINEQGRPKSMPLNKSMCNSADYNYASGRLDFQTYYAQLDVDREDCSDLVLEKVFSLWFDMAIVAFGWLGGIPDAVGPLAKLHMWDWPKHQVADIKAEASANAEKLQSGQIGLHRLYSESGLDLEDEIPAMAQSYGVTDVEVRQRLFDICLPASKPAASPQQPEQPPPAAASLDRVLPHLNGATNGKH